MSRTHVFGWSAAAAGALLVLCSSPASAQTAKTPTFTKDIAPIFQAKCEACHRTDQMAPMSLVDLRRGAALGEVDRGARRRAADAAVAHRQDGRHPEVQERSVAVRRADRDHRLVGGRRRAEGRPEGHAGRRSVAGRRRKSGSRRRSRRSRTWSIKSPAYTMPARRAGRLVEADRRRPASPSRAGCARSRSARRP